MTDSKDLPTLKPRELRILLVLGDGERHGWSIVKELQAQAGDGVRILPGSLYRTLNDLVNKGLIEEVPMETIDEDDGRRRYLRLTELGIETARANVDHLEELVRAAKSKAVFFPSGARA